MPKHYGIDFIGDQPPVNTSVINSAGSPYAAVDRDELITDGSGAITVTLPAPGLGVRVMIKDGARDWGTNNITIGTGADTIEGVAGPLTLDEDGAWVELIGDGASWKMYTP